jgi:hypothetical protein
MNQIHFDWAVIEKCNFIWKPFNFYEKETHKKIDRRLIKHNASNLLIYNHFEVLKNISTKSGLIKSLREYYL